MSKICPHCKKSTTFMVTLVAQGKATLVNDAYELLEQGELGIQEGSLVCADCGQPVKEAELLDGMACAKCGTIHPVTELLQLQDEAGNPGDIICNPCYEAMCNPQPEPQVQEQAPAQQQAPVQEDPRDAIIAKQQADMQAMMANMQAMQAQLQAMSAGQVPVANTQNTASVPVQQPTVATNIPAPTAPVQPQHQAPVSPVAPAAPTQQNTINVGQVHAEQPVGGDIFGGEAPF